MKQARLLAALLALSLLLLAFSAAGVVGVVNHHLGKPAVRRGPMPVVDACVEARLLAALLALSLLLSACTAAAVTDPRAAQAGSGADAVLSREGLTFPIGTPP